MRYRSMRSPWFSLLVAGLGLALLTTILPQAALAQGESPAYAPGEVVVGWSPDSGVLPTVRRAADRLDDDRASPDWQRASQALAALTGLPVLDAQPEYGTARLAVASGREQAESARLSKLAWVRYAEPNYIAWATAAPDARPQDSAFYPNDPDIGRQWHMRRIAAPEAWSVTFGSDSLVIAVVDSGVEREHPEFGRQFRDPLLPGYDYVNGDSDPDDETGNSHGTHVAGLLAAAANNGYGVAGLAPQVKLLPLKVLDSSGGGRYANIALAIRRAADFGAQVINLSLGGSTYSYDLQNAVDYALNRPTGGALIVAAAGNCAQGGQYCSGVNPDFYPAAYPGVLAVAASDHFDNWAEYSGYKPYIKLAAPGGITGDPIWSTVRGGYGALWGSSMAAPQVSGAAALVWTMRPTATYQQVAAILQDTADKVGIYPATGQVIPYNDGRNDYFGYGRLNVGRAVRQAHPPALTAVTSVQQFLVGGTLMQGERQVRLTNPSRQELTWQATVIEGAGWLGVNPAIGTAKDASPGVLTLRVTRGVLAPGVYTGRVRIQALYVTGIPSFEIPVQLRVSDTLRRVFLPGVPQDWLGGWLDPFAPGGLGGQGLYLEDNTVRQMALPFPVGFYGETYTALWVSDNGLVTLGVAPAGAPPAGCLPTAAAPNRAIYVLGLDWRPDLGGQVYIHQPDPDTYVITWYQVRRVGNALAQTFQIVLRRSGLLTANYLTVEPLVPGIIGVENWDGTVAQQIWCHGAGQPVAAGDSVRFDPVLPW